MKEKKEQELSLYLQKLEFDESLNRSWLSFFIDRMRFTFLVMLVILVAGIIGFQKLPLESMPEVNIGIVLVNTMLPWASPETIEDLVTKKIEKAISKVKDIDSITSYSFNSVSSITVQLKGNADIQKTVRDIESNINAIKKDLPQDTQDPVIQEFSYSEIPIWIFSLSWDYDIGTLYEYGKIIKEELEKNPYISRVNITWAQDAEYGVFIHPKKLEEYGLTLQQVNQAIQAQYLALPLWTLSIGTHIHTLGIDTRFSDIETIKNLIIGKSWELGIIRLQDVADVSFWMKKITSLSRTSIAGNPSFPSITLSVVKKKWGSIINLVNEGNNTIENLRKKWLIPGENKLSIQTLTDMSERIKLDFQTLIRDGIYTVILVFVTLFIFIWLKEALVAGTVVPLTFLITFAIMAFFWQTLNFLSMFSLILSLWLLVDDSIVVVSAIHKYKQSGKFTTREATILVLRDYKEVLITTTLTVVFIFASMMFMTGMIGKFIFSIPFVVTITLTASLFVSLTINPALAVLFGWRDKKYIPWESQKQNIILRFFKKIINEGILSLSFVEKIYTVILRYIIQRWYRIFLFFVCIGALFASSVLLLVKGILKTDFFPKGNEDIFYINIETEPGTKLAITNSIVEKVETLLLEEREIASYTVNVWWLSQSRRSRNVGDPQNSENYASITVNLIKKEYGRKESSIDIAERIRTKVASIRDAKITVIEEWGGPPTGSDFELEIAWDDFDTLEKISQDVIQILKTIPWVINIETSKKPLPFEIYFSFDTQKLALYQLSIPQVSSFLKNAIDGTKILTIYKGTSEIALRTAYSEESVKNIESIKALKILTPQGISIPISEIVKIEFKPSVFSITRKNQKRVLTVTASADKTTTATLIKKEFDAKIQNYSLPSWYEFMFWWVNEENRKSIESLLISMVFGIMCIIATLILLYDSFRQSLMVMVTIPLSLIWVFYGLTFFDQPLSFPWLIGMVALFWIVVRNGIILFDKINANLKMNIPLKESIIEGGASRLEPIFLTSICTILGIIPITFSSPTWTALWLSIIFWLSASTFFTLFTLPILYYVLFYKKYKHL